jgi:hypothetical protein
MGETEKHANVQVWIVQDAQDAEDALKKFRERIALPSNRDKPWNKVGRVLSIDDWGFFGYCVCYTLSEEPIWKQNRMLIKRMKRKASKKLSDEKRCPRIRNGRQCDLPRGHKGPHKNVEITEWDAG